MTQVQHPKDNQSINQPIKNKRLYEREKSKLETKSLKPVYRFFLKKISIFEVKTMLTTINSKREKNVKI